MTLPPGMARAGQRGSWVGHWSKNIISSEIIQSDLWHHHILGTSPARPSTWPLRSGGTSRRWATCLTSPGSRPPGAWSRASRDSGWSTSTSFRFLTITTLAFWVKHNSIIHQGSRCRVLSRPPSAHWLHAARAARDEGPGQGALHWADWLQPGHHNQAGGAPAPRWQKLNKQTISPMNVSTAGTVDCVLTYCRSTLIDQTLLGPALSFFKSRDIGVSNKLWHVTCDHADMWPCILYSQLLQVINASPVSMGLLSTRGPPAWHPATPNIMWVS